MNLVKERRRVGAICGVCRNPDYVHLGLNDCGRPLFECAKCGDMWTNGTSGGEYMRLATPKMEGAS